MTNLNDVVVVKLLDGAMLCATYLGHNEASGMGFNAILLGNIGSVSLGQDRQDPTKLTYALIPWQVGDMQIVTDKIVAIGPPNEMALKEYERIFTRIVTPDIHDVAALQKGAHGKL